MSESRHKEMEPTISTMTCTGSLFVSIILPILYMPKDGHQLPWTSWTLQHLTFVPGAIKNKAQDLKAAKFVEDEDEYSVYSAVLSKFTGNLKSKLVVVDGLTSGLNITPLPSRTDTLGDVFDNDELSKECLRDFEAKNASFWGLERKLRLSKEYKLSYGELIQIDEDMRSGKDGWKNYYLRYPNSQGLYTLSRAGFDGEKRTAIVYIANRFSADGGWGRLVILKMSKSKRWRIYRYITLWIS